jgi:RimJ/RimL family protein N-acetyltransferase
VSAPPKTVLTVTAEEEAAIRAAVRGVDAAALGPGRTVAAPGDAAALAFLLADPAVSGPIYDIPRPITRRRMADWIERSLEEKQAGTGLLLLTLGPAGEVAGYSKITVWPDRSAAELAGAVRADRQGSGRGAAGAGQMFGWIFETLRVRLIGLTAALDNVRSAKLIDASGFQRMGERDAIRPDGTVRRSIYWEMTREAWRAKWGQ